MKTQISRDSFDITRNYSGVYLQQGRMIVDADVNELTDIAKARLEASLADAVGTGAPRDGAIKIVKSGANFVINPGRLYADGVPARFIPNAVTALNAQPDYRNPPALPANNFRIYADVWERPVTALEDNTLQDAGLHGADTATRTKTMLQVKWCDRAIDPLDPAGQNPRKGNSLLTLKLRLITAGADPCDPCAAEVVVDERIGNYLFRVEVHDVFTTGGQLHVVLKWSRDNGAEAYPFDTIPADFDQGDWVWEFFDGDSENLLGHHFPLSQKRRRGEIRSSFLPRPAAPLPNAFVRQWDGYAELNLTTGALVAGRDRGVDLATTLADTAHAFVKIDGATSSVLINLELLELNLGYGGKTFVAGDFWQVAVREAIDTSGKVVLGASGAEPPRGILHHYAALAEVDGAANLVAFTDAFRRRMSFPPLTDLRAADVGFTDHCSGLYGGAENVQQALDALCAIGAEDIGYVSPGCGTATAPSVWSLLATAFSPTFPNRDGVDKNPSVKDILDYLMCDLNAARLPYNGNLQAARWTDINESPDVPLTVQQALDDLVANLDARDIDADIPDCTDGTASGSRTMRELLGLPAGLQSVREWLRKLYCDLRATHIPLDRSRLVCADLATDASVVSVQDALDKLCQHAGDGCEVTVRVGELERRLREFAAGALVDIALCLLPGTHVIAAPISISGKRSIRIKGAPGASIIQFSNGTHLLSSSALLLEDLGLNLSAGTQLRLDSTNVSSIRCQYSRFGTAANPSPGVRIGTKAQRVTWRDNQMSDTWFTTRNTAVDFTDLSIVNDRRVVTEFRRLTEDPLILGDAVRFNEVVDSISDAVVAMPAADRTRWATIITARNPAVAGPLSVPAAPGSLLVTAAAGTTGAKTAKKTAAKKTSKTAAKKTASPATRTGGVPAAAVFAEAAAAMESVAADVPAAAAAGQRARILVGGAVGDRVVGRDAGRVIVVDRSAGGVSAGSKSFTTELAAAAPRRDAIRDAVIGGLLEIIFDSGVNVALALSSHRTDATIVGNDINGEVLLMNLLEASGTGHGNDAATDFRNIQAGLDLVPVGGGYLTFDDNRVDRLWALVPPLPISPERVPVTTPLNGFAVCRLQGNHIIDLRNAVVARSLAMSANHFDGVPQEDFDFLGRMLVRVFSVVGNTSTDPSAGIVMLATADARASSNYFTVRRV